MFFEIYMSMLWNNNFPYRAQERKS